VKMMMWISKGTVDIYRQEIYKSILDVVLDPIEEMDGEDNVLKHIKMSQNMPLDFKLAFNTLLKDNIIIEL
jgi:hypothetical protein